MKTKYLSSLLLFVTCCYLGACNKADNTNNTHPTNYFTDTSTNFMSCNINGISWHSTQDSLLAIWSNGRKDLIIKGFNYSYTNDAESIVFQLYGTDTLPAFHVYGVGAYPVTAYYRCLFKQNNDSLNYVTNAMNIGALSLSIDADGKRVNGQFNFNAFDAVHNKLQIINSGNFSIPLIIQ